MDVIQQIRRGPAVLLVGQAYNRLDTGSDQLLTLIGSKYGVSGEGYSVLFEPEIANEFEAFVLWSTEKAKNLPIPTWLSTVGAFPWSALYTTAVDAVWVNAFRQDWREFRTVYDENQRPDQPRSKSNLVCTLLYGSTSWHEVAPVPADRFSMRRRTSIATGLLRRLPEIVTPRGVLIIEGYDVDDWLTCESLVPILDEFTKGQVHIFSASPRLVEDRDIQHLASKGILVVHEESLASTISSGVLSGQLSLGSPNTGRETGHRIELKDRVLDVPLDLWRKTTQSAIILEDDVLRAPVELSKGARYSEFRRFLEQSEGKPDWKSIAREFPFPRAFEPGLERKVAEALRSRDLQEKPVIIHGATGSGKTTALSRLAYRIRAGREWPVLYIPRRTHSPVYTDIEAFSKWAEGQGASALLIVWDAMTGPEDYQDLARYLASRGRKVVIVGSLYRSEYVDPKRAIEVPRKLSATEAAAFQTHLARIDSKLASATPDRSFLTEDDFLVSLYRLLPPSRLQLREGVTREVGFAEATILNREKAGTTVQLTPRSAMQLALIESGLLQTLPPILEGTSELAGESVQTIQRLTGLVMVPGQFNLGVPLELLLRALGRETFADFVSLLNDTDVFEWYEDEDGNIDIGPRTSLEAEIVVRARLGGPFTEVHVIADLIRSMTAPARDTGSSREVEFISRVAQALDAPVRQASYRAHFREVADAFQDAREQRSVKVPQLMLQEAHLRREWAARSDESDMLDDRLDELDKAREVLDVALDETEGLSHFVRGNLYTELASVYATTAVALLRGGREQSAASEMYRRALDATDDARRAAPDTYYPLDVMAWATFDLIEDGLLTGEIRIEALTDVAVALEIADSDALNDKSIEQLRRRQLHLSRLFGNEPLGDRVFTDLLERGSSAGVVFRGFEMAGGSRRQEWSQASALDAFTYCREYFDRLGVRADQRLRELMLDLWWKARTGEELLSRERVALPFSSADWEMLLSLCNAALVRGESRRQTRLQFIRAIAEFQLRDFARAFETLADVERDSGYGRSRSRWNVIRAFVASTPQGLPARYDGIISEVYDGGRQGEIFIDSLQRRVPIRVQDFGGGAFERGQTVSGFHIAFSYQGAIADPPSAYSVARDRENVGRG